MPAQKHPEALVKIATVITAEQQRKLRALALLEQRPLAYFIREALRQYLDARRETAA